MMLSYSNWQCYVLTSQTLLNFEIYLKLRCLRETLTGVWSEQISVGSHFTPNSQPFDICSSQFMIILNNNRQCCGWIWHTVLDFKALRHIQSWSFAWCIKGCLRWANKGCEPFHTQCPPFRQSQCNFKSESHVEENLYSLEITNYNKDDDWQRVRVYPRGRQTCRQRRRWRTWRGCRPPPWGWPRSQARAGACQPGQRWWHRPAALSVWR